MQAHGRTDMTKLIIAFHNFANRPHTGSVYLSFCLHWYTAVAFHKYRNIINYTLRHTTKAVLMQASPSLPFLKESDVLY
jgi:hypothetical protein